MLPIVRIYFREGSSRFDDVFRQRPLGPDNDVELHFVPLFEALTAVALLHGCEVNEHILFTVPGNEPVSLPLTEPFYDSRRRHLLRRPLGVSVGNCRKYARPGNKHVLTKADGDTAS